MFVLLGLRDRESREEDDEEDRESEGEATRAASQELHAISSARRRHQKAPASRKEEDDRRVLRPASVPRTRSSREEVARAYRPCRREVPSRCRPGLAPTRREWPS